MKEIAKLAGRFLKILLLSFVLLLLLNAALFALCLGSYATEESPWTVAQETAQGLEKEADGFSLPAALREKLASQRVWAVLVDNANLQILWHTENVPASVPGVFTAAEIAHLNNGYIDGQPTFTADSSLGLVVIGYPQETYWKLTHPSWNYTLIKNLPLYALTLLGINVAAILLIYLVANQKFLRSVGPIAEGIQRLSGTEPALLAEQGLLSGLAHSINETGQVLQRQRAALQKKETARANWIAGVSHDIRTPLSMVMGYASQMAENGALDAGTRKKALVILKQSEKMRNLIRDLNLTTKLEYSMQPLSCAPVSLVSLVRQVVADFLNLDIEGKYPLEFSAPDGQHPCTIQADAGLLRRAMANLLQNSMAHNEEGCHIWVAVRQEGEFYRVVVEDDGIGATNAQIEALQHTPHYMMCDSDDGQQRHGLGLLIVRQIALAHHGECQVAHSAHGGFRAEISLPVAGEPL